MADDWPDVGLWTVATTSLMVSRLLCVYLLLDCSYPAGVSARHQGSGCVSSGHTQEEEARPSRVFVKGPR